MKRPIILAVLAASLGVQVRAQPIAPRAEVPIRFVRLSDGAARFAVPITIGGTTIEAGLDSGSTGLRVLPGVVAGSATAKGSHVEYSYSSGTRLKGVEADEPLSIGQPAAAGTVSVQLVQGVDCDLESRGRCPGVKVPLDQFGVQGDGLPGEGFKAILGVSMGRDRTPNPLMSLGVQRWIIELPRPGDQAPGRLILNPTDEETQGYTVFKVERAYADNHGGLHDAVRGCVQDLTLKRNYCGAATLDTGAPGIQVVMTGSEALLPEGDQGQVVFLQGDKPVVGAQFPIGDRQMNTRVTILSRPRIPMTQVLMGLSPYYAFSVLYDPKAGTVGLKARQ